MSPGRGNRIFVSLAQLLNAYRIDNNKVSMLLCLEFTLLTLLGQTDYLLNPPKIQSPEDA
jgi:hypothetical protein